MVEDIGLLIGMHIDGVLGSDFFQSCDVEVDFAAGRFSISDDLMPAPQDSIEVELATLPSPPGIEASAVAPVIEMRLGGQTLRSFVDTGSMFTMVHSSLVTEDFTFVRTIREFHPTIGWFEASLYDAPDLQVGSTHLGQQRVGAAKAFDSALKLETLGTKAVLGLQSLLRHQLFLSYRQKRLFIR